MKITVNNEIGREINHYKQYIDGGYENSDWYNWNTAENLASYPAPNIPNTKEGEWVEAELVWEIEHTKGWGELRADEVDLYVNSNATTRQIWKAKAEVDSVEQAADNWADKMNPVSRGSDSWAQDKESFIAGAKWREENPVRK